jgi:hypothetical protein
MALVLFVIDDEGSPGPTYFWAWGKAKILDLFIWRVILLILAIGNIHTFRAAHIFNGY